MLRQATSNLAGTPGDSAERREYIKLPQSSTALCERRVEHAGVHTFLLPRRPALIADR